MKRALRLSALLGLTLLLLAGCKPPKDTLYVLMYHHIVPEGEKTNPWTVTDVSLRQDLVWLKDNGYTTVLPSELADREEPLPEKAVMVTFDDGYESNYTLGFPVFQELEEKCAIALVTSLTDEAVPTCGVLTWDMCREMQDSGLVELGSHTHDLHSAAEEQKGPKGVQRLEGESFEEYKGRVWADLQTSIDTMTEHLGKPPVYLAYPHGLTDPWADEFVEEHFKVTVTTKYGEARVDRGLYDLPRRNVTVEKPVSKLLP